MVLPDLLDGLSWNSSDLYNRGTLFVIPELAVLKGDVDDDGSVNNLDITPFIGLLTAAGSNATAVPHAFAPEFLPHHPVATCRVLVRPADASATNVHGGLTV